LRHGSIPDSVFYFIDMELCQENLERYIKTQRENRNAQPMAMDQRFHIMKQIASGLAFIHNQGEVHRDLKPRNSIFGK
jgi:serine/threonine protein kinase